MKKLLLLTVLMLGIAGRSYGQADILSSFTASSQGTVSTTVVIPAGQGQAMISDLAFKMDAGVTSGTVNVVPGRAGYSITSATASGSVYFFDNTGSHVVAGSYVIFDDVSTGVLTLNRVLSATTTSCTTQETMAAATTTSDFIFSTLGRFNRPIPQSISTTIGSAVNIWLPSGVPSALFLDGNTTACSLFIDGIRRKD